MNIAIMCEFSGRVREAFRERGHNVWSIDLEPSEIPGQHIQGNCLEYLGGAWEFDCGTIEPLSNDPRSHCCEGKCCFFNKIKGDLAGPLFPGMENIKRKCQGKPIYFTESKSSCSIDRSRTFPGIARVMAEQWG